MYAKCNIMTLIVIKITIAFHRFTKYPYSPNHTNHQKSYDRVICRKKGIVKVMCIKVNITSIFKKFATGFDECKYLIDLRKCLNISMISPSHSRSSITTHDLILATVSRMDARLSYDRLDMSDKSANDDTIS